jgi:hypothetical protein
MVQAAAPTEPARRPWARHLSEWLGNPLVVTLVGALVASWLIPSLTRQWQDHQKALEIKSGLVGEMSEASSEAVATAGAIAGGLYQAASTDALTTQRAFNDAVRNWAVRSAVVGSRLEAYFPRAAVGPAWRRFSTAVADYLQLAAKPNGSRAGRVGELRAVVPDDPRIRWQVLTRTNTGASFQRSYAALGQSLLDVRDALVQRVLDRSPSGF